MFIPEISMFFYSFSDARGVYVVYFPLSNSISITVVNPFQNKELSVSLLDKQFHDACQSLSVDLLTGSRVLPKVQL